MDAAWAGLTLNPDPIDYLRFSLEDRGGGVKGCPEGRMIKAGIARGVSPSMGRGSGGN